MEIRPIPDDVRSALRSGSNLLTISHCINELVYNSIDAETKSIDIRVDLDTFTFQVVDDGNGITKTNLNEIGTRNMTSKCYNLTDYTHNSKYYGFRGETLCSLINICKSVTIHSRPKNSDETYRKIFVNGINSNDLEKDTVTRPSYGTTVIVNGWMQNLPVRQKQVNPIYDLIEIKNQIEKIAIIQPNISFSLRNNSNKRIVLSIRRRNSILYSINLIFGKNITEHFKYVHFEHRTLKITGYVNVKAIDKCDIQLIYLNRRFIKKSRIHKYLRCIFSNCDLLSANPVYFLHFECPYADFEMLFKEYSIKIVFNHPDKILKYTEKAITKLLLDENLVNIIDKKMCNHESMSENCSRIGITQFDTILKSKIATKSSENLLAQISHPKSDKEVEQSKEKLLEKCNDFDKSKTNTESSIVVINKHVDYRQQLFENLNLSQNTQEKVHLTDDEIFKTPTAPPLRRKVRDSKSVLYNVKDCVKFSQKKLSSQTTVKTYDSHANRFVHNKAKTEKFIPECTAVASTSNGEITPRTKVSNWLNDLDQDSAVSLVNHHKNNQVQIKPKKITKKRRRSIDSCQKENTDSSLELQNQVDSTNQDNRTNRYDEIRDDVCSKRIKVLNDNIRSSPNRSDPYSENLYELKKSIAKLCSIQEKSFEIPFRSNPAEIEVDSIRQFCNIDENSEIEIITPKPMKFYRQMNEIISKNKTISTSKNFQIQNVFENHTRNNMVFDLSTPINCNQIMETKKLQENFKWKFNMTPYPTEIPKLFDSISDSFKLSIPQSILNETIIKPNSVTIASVSGDSHFHQIPSEKNIKENIDSNSFILNKYFDQYANNNMLKSVPQDPLQDDTLSDVDETEFKNGLDKVVTSTVRTTNSNKESEAKFQLIKRLDIIPKGMSQILDDTNRCICRNLSPRTRNELMEKIKKKYEDKLNFDRDLESYGRIFDKRFAIRQQIQISMTKKSKICRSYSFSKSIFNKLKILNQVDKKFIATFLEPTFTENGVLILFDQHAVHERIRLEKLLKDYEKFPGISRATKLDEILTFNLDSCKKEIMENCRINFENHGFIYTITDDSVNISSIPTCIFNKSCREKNSNRNNLMATLTMTLINELIEFCLETNGITNFFPHTVLTIINSEACRGATKFGDELSMEECELYIKQLSNCSLPFQCAHGRPTLVPIFEINSIGKIYDPIKINFQNISK